MNEGEAEDAGVKKGISEQAERNRELIERGIARFIHLHGDPRELVPRLAEMKKAVEVGTRLAAGWAGYRNWAPAKQLATFESTDEAQGEFIKLAMKVLKPQPSGEALGRFEGILKSYVKAVLNCPKCQVRHVDREEWATKPHRTHQCEKCSHVWKPFPFFTVGVEDGERLGGKIALDKVVSRLQEAARRDDQNGQKQAAGAMRGAAAIARDLKAELYPHQGGSDEWGRKT